MYITNTSNRPSPVECPVVCEQPLRLDINLLGAVFGLTCLALYFANKKFFLHARSKKKKLISQILTGSFFILLLLFLLYFIKLEYKPAKASCQSEGVLLRGKLLPDIWPPLYTTRSK